MSDTHRLELSLNYECYLQNREAIDELLEKSSVQLDGWPFRGLKLSLEVLVVEEKPKPKTGLAALIEDYYTRRRTAEDVGQHISSLACRKPDADLWFEVTA